MIPSFGSQRVIGQLFQSTGSIRRSETVHKVHPSADELDAALLTKTP